MGLGPELYGFLVALHRDEAEAADVFSFTSEALWRSLPAFLWGCSLRTWMYKIAPPGHASLRHRKGAKRRERGAVPVSECASSLVAALRTETRPYLLTEHKERLRRLREALPSEDKILLVLRLDRRMAWTDIARVMLEAGGEPDAETLSREAARVRKRFQLVKDKLVAEGRKEGFLSKRTSG